MKGDWRLDNWGRGGSEGRLGIGDWIIGEEGGVKGDWGIGDWMIGEEG